MPFVSYDDLVGDPDKYSELIFKSNLKGSIFGKFLKDVPIYLKYAYDVARENSHDPRTNVGAVIYNLHGEPLFEGANTLSKGTIAPPHSDHSSVEELRTNTHSQTEYKYFYMEHAERNAIFNCCFGSSHMSLFNKVMVCPYFACADCSRVIARSKIPLLIGHKEVYAAGNPKLQESLKHGRQILDGAGVYYTEYSGKLNCDPILMNGAQFYP